MSATPPPPQRPRVDLPARPAAANLQPSTERTAPPERIAAALATTWLEVRTGRRPVAQLLPYVAPAVRRRLVAQLPAATRLRETSGTRVHRVIARYPDPDVCEATVLIDQAGRITALAIRLERRSRRWAAVELSTPESGLAPLSSPRPRATPELFDADEEAAKPLTG